MSRLLTLILLGSALFLNLSVGMSQERGSGRAASRVMFVDSGQRLGHANSSCVALGDVDGDGDLDAFVANSDEPSALWLNNGSGRFANSTRDLGNASCAALSDLDGDHDPDVFVVRAGPNTVLFNDDKGGFRDSKQTLGTLNSNFVALGDLDRDGDVDALVTNWKNEPRTVWLNDGKGFFLNGDQRLSSAYYNSSATLADLDGDGDLDLFAPDNATQQHKPAPNGVWFNDGRGVFTDSGQRLGSSCSYAAALQDLDGDGDLDAFIANSSHAGANPANEIWLNNGKGGFVDSGQRLGRAYSMAVALDDLDGDGDLDAFVGNYQTADHVWLNDGAGRFTDSGVSLGRSNGAAVALADLDGDGDIDAFVANNTWQGGDGANTVWLNQTTDTVSQCSPSLDSKPLPRASRVGSALGSAAESTVAVQRNVMVPMRDGIRLATDVYRPECLSRPVPVILIRLPYSKDSYSLSQSAAEFFAGHGYAVAVQDVRGTYASEGTFRVFGNELTDGYDAITWAASQPWSNGKVGTYGCSYLGEVQIIAASQRHPNHTAMIAQAAGGAVGSAGERCTYFGLFEGGVFKLAGGFDWLSVRTAKPSGPRPDDAPNLSSLLKSLPVVKMFERLGLSSEDWQDFLNKDWSDPWWARLGYITDTDRFDVPTLHVNSWFDYGVSETLALFNLMARNAQGERARRGQFAIISPTEHCASESATEHTSVGGRDFGDARLGYWDIYLRWFDHWLKGASNDVLSMPRLQLYIMGRNTWRGENEWPLARTVYTPFYFHSTGQASTSAADGQLNAEQPLDEGSDQFSYDPGDPVPSGRVGGYERDAVAGRSDVLVYTSPELGEGLEVTGPIKSVLYVSSSARDTDFVVKLLDVEPSGAAFCIQEGILRARYREGFDRSVWMESGVVYKLEIDLHATAHYFPPGHRVRVQIASSSFPKFARNLNTNGSGYHEARWVVATNTLHHSGKHPSHILLPVVP